MDSEHRHRRGPQKGKEKVEDHCRRSMSDGIGTAASALDHLWDRAQDTATNVTKGARFCSQSNKSSNYIIN